MIIQKYSINNIFKLILVFGVAFGATNSVWANDNASNTLEESSTKNQELPNNEKKSASEGSSAPQQTTNQESNLNNREDVEASEAKEQSEANNPENFANQDFLTLKNILLLFAIIDLPIIALVLTLWFVNRKEQKQKFESLAENQSKIERKLKQLEKTTLKLDDLDKSQDKIIKQIENNKQETINSRVKLLEAFKKKQSDGSINSNGNSYVVSNNYDSLPTFTKEIAEHQLDKHSYNQVAVIEQIPQFVDKYNLNKKSLSNEAIATVSATETSLNERRLGKSDILTLEPTPQKKYWIVKDKDYYLVPHAKIKIDEYNKTTLESLFECINFSPNYKDLHLIEPAKVSQINSESWQLEKKGKLEFS